MATQEEILRAIKLAFIEFETKHGTPPNRLVLGVQYAAILQPEFIIYSHTEAVTIFGVPVEIDFVNNKRLAVGVLEDV